MQNTNLLLRAVEWYHDVVTGQNAQALCQWRGAVVPAQRLVDMKDFISELLMDSHVRTDAEIARDGDAGLAEPYTLEMIDGTLVSFMLIRGSRTNMRELDTATKALKITQRLAAYMNTGNGDSHSFAVHFLHDPHTADQVFEQKVAPMIATASRFGGDASRFVADLRSRLVAGAAEEMSLFVVRTHIRGMRPDERKQMEESYRQMVTAILASGKGVKNMQGALYGEFGQALLARSVPILQRHEGLVNRLLKDFNSKDVGISVMLLAVREAFERVRRYGDRELPQDSHWLARLFGQKDAGLPPTANTETPAPLALGMQVVGRKVVGHIRAVETATIGNTWYGTTVMEQGPTSPQYNPSQTMFSTFIQKVKDSAIPVCVTFEILPHGLNYNRLNQFFNSLLGGIGSTNRQIRAAYKDLREYQEAHGKTDPVIGLRVAMSTWGPRQDVAEKALLELNLAVQGWGGAQPNAETGYPDVARLASIPEYSATSAAPVLPAPLSDVVYMSPMMRIASPWEHGQLLFKTNDGVIYPVGIGTSKHTSYVTGIFAPPGYGKSFLTNRIHSCLALSPGATQIPYITVIDVAPSSKGTQRLLRTILPKRMHHLMTYFKVINDAQYCVNPFDLQLGCFKPTGAERDFITAVLEVVFDGLGDEAPKLIDLLITEAYQYFDPDSTTARLWQNSNDERVARELAEIGFRMSDDVEVTVFQVVDALFKAGRIEAARIAQRHAVPRMEDLSRILQSENIARIYGSARIATGELLLQKAARDILNASAAYPVLAGVTRVDLENARIITIDLQTVLAGSSSSGAQFAGMMYLYARHLGARNYFLDVDDIKAVCRPDYLEYQVARVREIQQTPKVLSYDEWHNVNRVKGMISLNIKETRETRKFRVYVNYISQYLTDAPPDVLDGMTSIFIVGAASFDQNKHAAAKLGLSDTDLDILQNEITVTGRVWAYFKLRDGPVTALLNNNVGPLETWCYTTDDRDAPLRQELEDEIGETEAILMLAREFPTGSAGSYLDTRSRERGVDHGAGRTITAVVAEELTAKYHEAVRKGEEAFA